MRRLNSSRKRNEKTTDMANNDMQWTDQQHKKADEVLSVIFERSEYAGPKLRIILGKNIGPTFGRDRPISRGLIFYPELKMTASGMGDIPVPKHPDDFVPQAIERATKLLLQGRGVEIWTMSEYLVSRIAGGVGENDIAYQCVEVRLYADDNSSFRRFGISRDGLLCNIGDGDWPFGWFMPSN